MNLDFTKGKRLIEKRIKSLFSEKDIAVQNIEWAQEKSIIPRNKELFTILVQADAAGLALLVLSLKRSTD